VGTVGNKVFKKKFAEANVYDAAVARFDLLFDRFDRVVVSFSGGKDSTVCLNLALEAARRHKRLPLDVYFWDEEAIHPETVDYVERVARNPDVRMKWLVLPIKHRNACSRREPWWYCWDEAARDRWVRPFPTNPWVVTEIPGFWKGASVPEVAHLVYGTSKETIADVRGIRADESLRRYRSVAHKLKENWIGAPRNGHNYPVSPIYDWTTFDVWTAPRLHGWDYNRTYDLMSLAGMTPGDQRVCPPYGEEPLKGLWIYAQCWPDLWHKMIRRVHGAATAGRYARTTLYAFGGDLQLPPGLTWREWMYAQIELYPQQYRAAVSANVAALIADHRSKTGRPIPDDKPDLLTGISWKYLAMIANRGDFKMRRAGQMTRTASQARSTAGVELIDVSDGEAATRY
jgi:predicted phosphoadenosine phosphosulfate sulfurtransferase